MIRKTLAATQLATYSVDLPNDRLRGMPSPAGTGFFISSDGWFVTAAHVITENGRSDESVRKDIDQGWLMKERRGDHPIGGMCQHVRFEYIDPLTDFALLKVDFSLNSEKVQLVGRTGFPFLEVSSRPLDEGEPVYAFGYPLSHSSLLVDNQQVVIGHVAHSPRTTSAVVASTMDTTNIVSTTADPRVYVLDKALNYGNSGGPIIATGTGKVHAFCSRFQPVGIPQNHIKDEKGNPIVVLIPSLYGVVSSLGNPTILEQLHTRKIPISTT